jgi:hypothetical protein
MTAMSSIGHSEPWVSFFDEPGHYRITVCVSGNNKTEFIELPITWRGKWNDFEME